MLQATAIDLRLHVDGTPCRVGAARLRALSLTVSNLFSSRIQSSSIVRGPERDRESSQEGAPYIEAEERCADDGGWRQRREP